MYVVNMYSFVGRGILPAFRFSFLCSFLPMVFISEMFLFDPDISRLQNEDGSFCGDEYGEIDTRFSYCAVAALWILDRLDVIDKKKAVEFIVACQNFDGGYGAIPGNESHAGQVFTCVAALHLLESLDRIDSDLLSWW